MFSFYIKDKLFFFSMFIHKTFVLSVFLKKKDLKKEFKKKWQHGCESLFHESLSSLNCSLKGEGGIQSTSSTLSLNMHYEQLKQKHFLFYMNFPVE